jgi:hypothetical protein
MSDKMLPPVFALKPAAASLFLAADALRPTTLGTWTRFWPDPSR